MNRLLNVLTSLAASVVTAGVLDGVALAPSELVPLVELGGLDGEGLVVGAADLLVLGLPCWVMRAVPWRTPIAESITRAVQAPTPVSLKTSRFALRVRPANEPIPANGGSSLIKLISVSGPEVVMNIHALHQQVAGLAAA